MRKKVECLILQASEIIFYDHLPHIAVMVCWLFCGIVPQNLYSLILVCGKYLLGFCSSKGYSYLLSMSACSLLSLTSDNCSFFGDTCQHSNYCEFMCFIMLHPSNKSKYGICLEIWIRIRSLIKVYLILLLPPRYLECTNSPTWWLYSIIGACRVRRVIAIIDFTLQALSSFLCLCHSLICTLSVSCTFSLLFPPPFNVGSLLSS